MRSLHLMYIDGTETSEEAKTNSFGPKNGAINWHGLIACISVVRSFYDVAAHLPAFEWTEKCKNFEFQMMLSQVGENEHGKNLLAVATFFPVKLKLAPSHFACKSTFLLRYEDQVGKPNRFSTTEFRMSFV